MKSGSYDISKVKTYKKAPELFIQSKNDKKQNIDELLEHNGCKRIYEYKHPVEVKVPFLPKFCCMLEEHTIHWVSPTEFLLLITNRSSGVPYADCWYL